MKNEYRWHLLDNCLPKAFSFLAALWASRSNEGDFIVVMQSSFQGAVSADRKRKGQDSERLKQDRFMLTVPTRNPMFMHALEKYGYGRGFAVRLCSCQVMRCSKTTTKAGRQAGILPPLRSLCSQASKYIKNSWESFC